MAEKAEGDTGWLFPVGDEVAELGYRDMFVDMFDAWDENREPMETLYDGYVVNAVVDACYQSAKSKQWEPIELAEWRGGEVMEGAGDAAGGADEKYALIKRERMPDGRMKLILKDKESGEIVERIEE